MNHPLDSWTAVILAAGQGKRMRSSLPKVLHPLAGRSLVRYVVDAAREAGVGPCLAGLAGAHQEQGADLTFLTARAEEAGEYGCVQRDSAGRVTAVVEAPERGEAAEGLAEINAGQY